MHNTSTSSRLASWFVVALFSAAFVVGCGGGSGGGGAAPTPTVQGVTVSSSSDLIFIGASETFTASAALSGGGTQPVTAGTWGSDTPSVATADGTGRVTGVGSGMATIFVDYQGRRGTKLIRGLPSFQGAWSGSYAVTGCSHTGDFARNSFCSNFGVNRVLPTNLNLTQDRDRVQGRFFLGTLGGDATGPVQTNGQLLLTGAVQDPAATIETSWTLTSTTAGRITGTLSLLWRAPGLSGDMRINADIRDLNRTSGIASPAPMGSASGGSLAALLRSIHSR